MDTKRDQLSKNWLQDLELRVDLVIFTLREQALQVLLRQRDTHPFQDCWEIPGSAVRPNESLEDCMNRVLKGTTGLEECFAEQLYTYGDPSRYPHRRVVSCVYYALIPAGAGDPAHAAWGDALAWHPMEDLPPLAFDHEPILQYALRRLRYKLEYSAVGFELVPEEFTLSELQQAYEIILGESLDKRNFRRRLHAGGVIEPTDRFRGGEGRPARLYRFRPDAVAEVKARRLFP
jgi:8-oxo-dGTP diphosphatase